ncbi:crossover junction endodeoxyribonuclease RuvC [Candidatus Methylospira mobilis]|uniref:Crossover junction endodeoxyribonuclease RuvC n=1 Tax=Candidatus Methylospira mobilis TaxID=1808979 RepID=A0A5Q0BHJ4_9GAMM|nr:crossover junction endodeoxyribonuclease RuvC [Candidatus Methylospira mobilis]QFY41598.1 crossover junction endodeoxyribonuclease RuvC [Candidatus Methylospira mobilis]WNV05158.1 crossover junction endodeoxyribonuclease RuvC [Candidatus Methylospira mobilis]
MRIMGIDPGSRITGYGVVEVSGGRTVMLISGCVHAEAGSFPERLKQIYDGIYQIALAFQPDEMAIEQVFLHKNADSALKLGQARGAAICGALAANLPVHEYSARQVKLALVGKGNADKLQVQHMVKVLLGSSERMAIDASDALGVALCHAHTSQTEQRIRNMTRGARR